MTSGGEYVRVGRVGRPHGLDGSFFVEDASDDPDRFAKGAAVYVDGRAATVAVSKRGAGGRPVVRLDVEVARGAELSVRRAELPAPGPDEYYASDLVGLAVEEDGGRALGRVADVTPGVANDILELDTGTLLPMVGECVREVDLDRGRIVIAPGFVDPQLP